MILTNEQIDALTSYGAPDRRTMDLSNSHIAANDRIAELERDLAEAREGTKAAFERSERLRGRVDRAEAECDRLREDDLRTAAQAVVDELRPADGNKLINWLRLDPAIDRLAALAGEQGEGEASVGASAETKRGEGTGSQGQGTSTASRQAPSLHALRELRNLIVSKKARYAVISRGNVAASDFNDVLIALDALLEPTQARRIVDTGPKHERVDPDEAAGALGAEPTPATCQCGHQLDQHKNILDEDTTYRPCRECDCRDYGEGKPDMVGNLEASQAPSGLVVPAPSPESPLLEPTQAGASGGGAAGVEAGGSPSGESVSKSASALACPSCDGTMVCLDCGERVEPTQASRPTCPQCQGPLSKVTYPPGSMLNREQFDSQRAGDFYCTTCPGDEAYTGHKYWWKSDLEPTQASDESGYMRGHSDGWDDRHSAQEASDEPPTDRILHVLWTKAVGTDGYIKSEWRELERIVHGAVYPTQASDEPPQEWCEWTKDPDGVFWDCNDRPAEAKTGLCSCGKPIRVKEDE